MRLYESMFLVDNSRAKEDVDGVVEELKELVTRTGGEVVNAGKWDERKLMYQIDRHRRGTYVLCHWNGPADAPAKLERQCLLAESVLRVLTVRDEDGTEIKGPRDDYHPRRDRDRDRDRDRGRGRDRRSRGGRDRDRDRGRGRDRPKERSRDTGKDTGKDTAKDTAKDAGKDGNS